MPNYLTFKQLTKEQAWEIAGYLAGINFQVLHDACESAECAAAVSGWDGEYLPVLEGIILTVCGQWPASVPLGKPDSGVRLGHFEFGCLVKADYKVQETRRNWLEVLVETTDDEVMRVRFHSEDLHDFAVEYRDFYPPRADEGFKLLRDEILNLGERKSAAHILLVTWEYSPEGEAMSTAMRHARQTFVTGLLERGAHLDPAQDMMHYRPNWQSVDDLPNAWGQLERPAEADATE